MAEDFDKLVDDIRSCGLDLHPEASGFLSVYCPICGKTNKRTGGFRFEPDTIVYNCFRGSCDASCVYREGEPISRKFRRLMDDIGVTIPPKLRMVRSSLQRELEKVDSDLYVEHRYHRATFPDATLTPLTDDKTKLGQWWRNEMDRRYIPYQGLRVVHDGQYKGCCMIPFWMNGTYIGCQYLTRQGVYIANNDGNSHLLYSPSGYLPHDIVILVEGAMDARSIPFGVATLGKKVTPEQAWHLKGKKVVMLPDRKGNKYHEQFADYGWDFCVPRWTVKDVNEAVVKHGLIVTTKMIIDNTFDASNPTKALAAYKIWREDG